MKQVNRMFQTKQQIFKCLIRLAEENNPNVTMPGLPIVPRLMLMTHG